MPCRKARLTARLAMPCIAVRLALRHGEASRKARHTVGLTLFFLGVISTSNLKLELEFEPVPTITWYIFFTFVYTHKITFSGNKLKQEVTYDYLK
jgi:hypothetical protein